jgi:hypothetical protein
LKGKSEESSDSDGQIPTREPQPNICCICDLPLTGARDSGSSGGGLSQLPLAGDGALDHSLASALVTVDERSYTLNCGHTFHSFCIRGWTMVGKKDTCAKCNEKVALSDVLRQPWQKPSVLWSALLDAVRWIIAINPLIFLSAQFLLMLIY